MTFTLASKQQLTLVVMDPQTQAAWVLIPENIYSISDEQFHHTGRFYSKFYGGSVVILTNAPADLAVCANSVQFALLPSIVVPFQLHVPTTGTFFQIGGHLFSQWELVFM